MQIRAQMGAVKLEKSGFKVRGRSISVRLKEFYGLPKRASYDDVLASLADDLKAVDEQFLAASHGEPNQ